MLILHAASWLVLKHVETVQRLRSSSDIREGPAIAELARALPKRLRITRHPASVRPAMKTFNRALQMPDGFEQGSTASRPNRVATPIAAS